MEAVSTELAGVLVHAVPQTLSTEDLRAQLERAADAAGGDATDLLLAHVALTSLPARAWGDVNELEVEESAFDRRFDLRPARPLPRLPEGLEADVVRGGDRRVQLRRPSGRRRPEGDRRARHRRAARSGTSRTRTSGRCSRSGVEAGGMGPGELVDAVEQAGRGTPEGADRPRVPEPRRGLGAFRQVGAALVPGGRARRAPRAGRAGLRRRDLRRAGRAGPSGPSSRSGPTTWKRQDLTGLDRERVVRRGSPVPRRGEGRAGVRLLELSLRNYRVFEEVDLELPARVIGVVGDERRGEVHARSSRSLFALYGVDGARTKKDGIRTARAPHRLPGAAGVRARRAAVRGAADDLGQERARPTPSCTSAASSWRPGSATSTRRSAARSAWTCACSRRRCSPSRSSSTRSPM